MRFLLFVFTVLSLLLAGCGQSIVESAASAALAKARAEADDNKAQAVAWKASDTAHQQQLADQGKTVAELKTIVTASKLELAQAAVKTNQAEADLRSAEIARDRMWAAIACGAFLVIAVAAYALSDYFLLFSWLLRPAAYVAGALAGASFVFRAIVAYLAGAECVIALTIGAALIFEVLTRTKMGPWLLALAAKFESSPLVKKAVGEAETEVTKLKADVEGWIKKA